MLVQNVPVQQQLLIIKLWLMCLWLTQTLTPSLQKKKLNIVIANKLYTINGTLASNQE